MALAKLFSVEELRQPGSLRGPTSGVAQPLGDGSAELLDIIRPYYMFARG